VLFFLCGEILGPDRGRSIIGRRHTRCVVGEGGGRDIRRKVAATRHTPGNKCTQGRFRPLGSVGIGCEKADEAERKSN